MNFLLGNIISTIYLLQIICESTIKLDYFTKGQIILGYRHKTVQLIGADRIRLPSVVHGFDAIGKFQVFNVFRSLTLSLSPPIFLHSSFNSGLKQKGIYL